MHLVSLMPHLITFDLTPHMITFDVMQHLITSDLMQQAKPHMKALGSVPLAMINHGAAHQPGRLEQSFSICFLCHRSDHNIGVMHLIRALASGLRIIREKMCGSFKRTVGYELFE